MNRIDVFLRIICIVIFSSLLVESGRLSGSKTSEELFLAAEDKDIKKIEEIITSSKGDLISNARHHGYSILNWVVIRNALPIVKKLLFLGANPEKTDSHNETAFECQEGDGNDEILICLNIARDFHYLNQGPISIAKRFPAFMATYVEKYNPRFVNNKRVTKKNIVKLRRNNLLMIRELLHLGSSETIALFLVWMSRKQHLTAVKFSHPISKKYFSKTGREFFRELLLRPMVQNPELDRKKMYRIKDFLPYCAHPFKFCYGYGPLCPHGKELWLQTETLIDKRELMEDQRFKKILCAFSKNQNQKGRGTTAAERKKLKMDLVFFFPEA